MSKQHPVVAVTGSSGAGTTTVKTAFEHIFRRLDLTASIIEGDSFHRYNRQEMRKVVSEASARGENITTLFVNNAIYGMTGGQMAPTSLPGQKTTSSPYGRDTASAATYSSSNRVHKIFWSPGPASRRGFS